jgi:FtsP/CotA-like multicopper oxidase with cupredoxin domain
MNGFVSRRQILSAGIAFSLVPLTSRLTLAEKPDEFRVLAAKPGSTRLLGKNGPSTEIWGYDGQVPGPVLRARRGGEIRVRLLNQLTQPTSIHWHGIRIKNSMDGAAGLTQKPVEPGDTFEYRFSLPDAGTYWYHPHMLASEQMDRGLYGLLIVDESSPIEIDQDIALLLDDWRLEKDGRIHESFGNFHDAAHQGRYGNYLTVNGQESQEIPVRTNELK